MVAVLTWRVQGLTQDARLLEQVANALLAKRLFAQAGQVTNPRGLVCWCLASDTCATQFLEKLGELDRAMDAYRQGHAYRQAVNALAWSSS